MSIELFKMYMYNQIDKASYLLSRIIFKPNVTWHIVFQVAYPKQSKSSAESTLGAVKLILLLFVFYFCLIRV